MLKLLSVVLKAATLWNAALPPLSCINNAMTHLQHKSVQVCGEINNFIAMDAFFKEIMKNRTILYTRDKPGNQPVHTDLMFLPPIVNIPYGINTYNRRAVILTDHLYGADQIFRKSQMLNAVLLHQATAYTWFPYDPSNCWQDRVPAQPIAECDLKTGVFNGGSLYPDKIPDNLQKCRLRVARSVAIPFSLGDSRGDIVFVPPEDTMIQIILEHLNMTIVQIKNELQDEQKLVFDIIKDNNYTDYNNQSNIGNGHSGYNGDDEDKYVDEFLQDISETVDEYLQDISENISDSDYDEEDITQLNKMHDIDKREADFEDELGEVKDILEDTLEYEIDELLQQTMGYFSITGEAIGTGLTLLQQKTDLNHQGASFDPNYSGKFEFTPGYAEDSLLWFVPTPRKVHHIYGFYTEFPQSVWILIIVTCCTFSVVLYWVSSMTKDCKLRDCTFTTYALIFSQNSKPPTKGGYLIEGLFLAFIFHIVTFYCNALLAHILIDPTEKPIVSAQEALNKGLIAHIRLSEMKVLLELEPALYNQMRKTGNYQLRSIMQTKCLVKKKCIILAQRFLDEVSYELLSADDKELHLSKLANILEPPLAKYRKVMYMSPGNPLAPGVNRLVQHIIETGIPDHCLQIVMTRSANIFHTKVLDNGLELLSLKRMQSAFYLYACLVIISIALFILEVLVYKVKMHLLGSKNFK